jgi:DNA-directed RNA polymerase specialized sigma24 family protein
MSFLHPSRWLALNSGALDPVLAPPRVPSPPGRHWSRAGGHGHEHHPARHRATDGGTPPGLAVLYHQYHQLLFRLAALLTGDASTAEMVVQDAFAARRRLRLPPDDPSALPYLCRLVVARARQAPRFQPQATTAAAAASGPREPLPGSPAIRAALRELPARQREAAMLTLYLDLTEEQAALAMRVSAAAVRRYLTAARAALQAVLLTGR